jgi:hypothetical protein
MDLTDPDPDPKHCPGVNRLVVLVPVNDVDDGIVLRLSLLQLINPAPQLLLPVNDVDDGIVLRLSLLQLINPAPQLLLPVNDVDDGIVLRLSLLQLINPAPQLLLHLVLQGQPLTQFPAQIN